MRWVQKGDCLRTSYGRATVTKVESNTATFRIMEPSNGARKLGYRRGDTFLAHPNDRTVPSPRKWKRCVR